MSSNEMTLHDTRMWVDYYRNASPEMVTIDDLDLLIEQMDDEPDDEADKLFIEILEVFIELGLTIGVVRHDTWRENWINIYYGRFPLDEIPPHVRDRAYELYYRSDRVK